MFQKGDKVKWINDKMSCVHKHGTVKRMNKQSCVIEYIEDWKLKTITISNKDLKRDK